MQLINMCRDLQIQPRGSFTTTALIAKHQPGDATPRHKQHFYVHFHRPTLKFILSHIAYTKSSFSTTQVPIIIM